METTEKKPNGGYSRLKVKYAKLKAEKETLEAKIAELEGKAKAEAKNAELQKEKEILVQTAQDNYCRVEKERDEWKAKYEHVRNATLIDNGINSKISELQATIEKQGTKISTLTADLANAQGEAREYRNKFEEAVRRMGGFRRFIYGYNIPQFTDEDHWHD